MKGKFLGNLGTTVSRGLGRAELTLKKNSPEILLGLGVVGFVGTVVVACRGTLKAQEVLKEHRKQMADIKEAKAIVDENPDELEYDEDLYRKDVVVCCTKTTVDVAKAYAPAFALGTMSLACIFAARNVMQKRYLGVLAAYNGLQEVFKAYRKRVVDEYGEGLDRHFRYGTTYDTLTEIEMTEDGKEIKKTVDVENNDRDLIVPKDACCRFFDEKNPNWDPNPTFSMMTLRGQENILNDIYHTRGHLFLNEVYDALGYPHTPEGAVLGWIYGEGPEYIDFGLRDGNDPNVRRFVNGESNVIMLTFNVQGVIWDKI